MEYLKEKRLTKLVSVLLILALLFAAPMPMFQGEVYAGEEDVVAYPVTGGDIYFDKLTGEITNCDTVVTSANIPQSIDGVAVTSIGARAFWDCIDLTSITIPNSVTSIGAEAFSCCDLTSITIPNSVTSIGANAFAECHGLTSITIPNSVTSIGERAFTSCFSLTSITIPNSVTSIEEDAFRYCDNLTSINVSANNNVYKDVGGVLFNKNQTKIIRFPAGKEDNSYIIPNGVTSIGDGAFNICENLTSITIPNSVTSIGDDAFLPCKNLTSINVSTNNSAYKDVSGVLFNKNQTEIIRFPAGKEDNSYVIPNGVTSIGDGAFNYCENLTSITIPNSVTSIGSDTFWGHDNLTIHGYKGSYAEEYAEEYDIPFVAIGGSFEIGKNTNTFRHSNPSFVKSEGYKLSKLAYSNLTKYSSKREKDDIKKYIKQHPDWGGSCHGIATTMCLVFNGHISTSDLSTTKKYSNYSSLKPSNDKSARVAINYYHLTQRLNSNKPTYAYDKFSFDLILGPAKALKGIVNSCKGGNVGVLAYAGTSGGHSIIACDYRYDKDKEEHVITLFDENTVDDQLDKNKKEGKFSYLRISDDYKTFEFDDSKGRTIKNSTCQYLQFFDADSLYQTKPYQKKTAAGGFSSTASQNDTLCINYETKCSIENSSGEILNFDYGDISGDLEIINIKSINNASVDGDESSSSSEVMLEISGSDSYSISSDSDKTDISLGTNDEYYSVKGTNIDSANIDCGDNMSIEGNNYNFAAAVSTANEVAENENGLVYISGNTTGTVDFNTKSENLSVNSSSQISGFSAESLIETDSIDINTPSTVNNVSIKNIKVKPAKADKSSGTYSLPISVGLSSDSGAQIRYTTDGTTPTEKSKLYTGKINISKTTAIKAIAFKNGMVNSDMSTYTYTIKPKIYKISLNGNGGKIGKKKVTYKSVTYGKQTGTLPVPKRKKYNFLGWFTKKKGGSEYTSGTIYKKAGNVTLYAQWTKQKTVKFNANGGVVTDYAKAVKKGKKYGKLPTPKRTGYKFKGWYTKKSGGKKITKSSKVKTKSNHTVYARWYK